MEKPSQRPTKPATDDVAFPNFGAESAKWKLRKPPDPKRRLRVYALDPSVGKTLESIAINETTLSVRWDDTPSAPLKPGPVGEYLEIVDIDPASNKLYDPVDLNSSRLLAQDGWPPLGRKPKVPSTDGVCGRHDDHRALRKGARPQDSVGAAKCGQREG